MVASSSARPTTLATASTWTGCTANSSPSGDAGPGAGQPLDQEEHEHRCEAVQDDVGDVEGARGPPRWPSSWPRTREHRQRPVEILVGPPARREDRAPVRDRVKQRSLLNDADVIVGEIVPGRLGVHRARDDRDQEHPGPHAPRLRESHRPGRRHRHRSSRALRSRGSTNGAPAGAARKRPSECSTSVQWAAWTAADPVNAQ